MTHGNIDDYYKARDAKVKAMAAIIWREIESWEDDERSELYGELHYTYFCVHCGRKRPEPGRVCYCQDDS